jgi:molybdopterin-guanine dinucleotide biosynthesis protein A
MQAGRPSLTGLILAGGRSVRMGRDKATLEFEGEPMLLRVARLLRDACDEILVASGDGVRLKAFGLPQVADAAPAAGPLGGLVAGLERASNLLIAAVAVDMPFVNAGLLRAIASLWVSEDAVVPISADGPEPLHAVYARTAAEPLRGSLAAGTFGLRLALATLRVRFVDDAIWRASDPSGTFARNLNAPADLGGAIPPGAAGHALR